MKRINDILKHLIILFVLIFVRHCESQIKPFAFWGSGLITINPKCSSCVISGGFGNSIMLGSALNNVDSSFFNKFNNFTGWTKNNKGVSGYTTAQILTTFINDTNSYSIITLDGEINDANTIYADSIIKNIRTTINLAVSRGMYIIYCSRFPSTPATNNQHYTLDTVDANIKSFIAGLSRGHVYCVDKINNVLGIFRAGTTNPNNHYDFNPIYAGSGNYHPNQLGNYQIALIIYECTKTVFNLPAPVINDLSITSINDSLHRADQRDTFNITCHTTFQTGDSLTMDYRDSVNSTNIIHLSFTQLSGTTYTLVRNVDTSKVKAGDTLFAIITLVVDNQKMSINKNTLVKDYLIPLDSLDFAINFNQQYGFKAQSYTQTIPTLFSNFFSTLNLQMGATTSAESTDPIDSSSFGFIYDDGSTKYAILTGNGTTGLILQSRYTIIIKMRGYTNTNGVLFGRTNGSGGFYIINRGTPASYANSDFTGGGNLIYRNSWLGEGVDTVIAVTDGGDISCNAVQRVTGGKTLTGTKIM